MRNIARLASILVCAFSLAGPVRAAEKNGVIMFDEIKIDETPLKLNGMGLRLATVFKVKVYVAGLYLETPSKDANAILDSAQVKVVDLEFLRDVGAGSVRDSWKEGFRKGCGSQCESLGPTIDTFVSLMTDMKKGDHMRFVFRKGGTELSIKNVMRGRVDGAAFSKIMLGIWIGKEPPNPEIKQGMLGL